MKQRIAAFAMFVAHSAAACGPSAVDPDTGVQQDVAVSEASSDGGATQDVAVVDSPSGDASDSAVTQDANQPDVQVTPSTCNALSLVDAPQVSATARVGTPPDPVGGTITDGTYFLTTLDIYGPPDAGVPTQLMASVYQFVGGTLQTANSNAFLPRSDATATYSVQGTNLTITSSCPSPEPAQTHGYDATSTTVVIHVGSALETFTLH